MALKVWMGWVMFTGQLKMVYAALQGKLPNHAPSTEIL
jgi:hypothetical protein